MWFLLWLVACSPAEIQGAVAKGPFVLGSSVQISEADAEGQPTGAVYNTETSSDLGEFELEVSHRGLALIEADGFYYNEVTGGLSGAPLTLRALTDLSGESTAYVNLITHLSIGRVRELLEEGESFSDAVSQAEAETRAAIGVGPAALDPGVGTSLNLLTGDTDGNAYLLAVGAVFMQAAIDRVGTAGAVDATLQEIVNSVASDLGPDGALSDPLRAELLAAQTHVDGDRVVALLAERFAAVGSAAVAPDIHKALDTDLDGVANRFDKCPLDLSEACLVEEIVVGEFDHSVYATLARIDDDAFPDVITNNYASGFQWAAGDGQGGFGPLQALVGLTDPWGTLFTSLDVNGDGLDDLVTTRPTGTGSAPTLNVYVNQGAGSFALDLTSTAWPDLGGSAIAGDLDGDSDVDLVVPTTWYTEGPTPQQRGSFRVLMNQYPAAFSDGPAAPTFEGSPLALWQPLLADFDEDGNLDLLVLTARHAIIGNMSYTPATAEWLRGRGDGSFDTPVAIGGPDEVIHVGVPTDIDGDGHLDLVGGDPILDPAPAPLRVYYGAGDGTFAPVEYDVPDASPSWAFDIDGDGSQELVVGSWEFVSPPRYAVLQLGAERAMEAPTWNVVPRDFYLFSAAGDLNDDGDDEVLAHSEAYGTNTTRSTLSVLDYRP